MKRAPLLLLASLAALGGCELAPRYQRPAAAVPAAWPQGEAYAPALAGSTDLRWDQIVQDSKLRGVITLALTHSQDLRASVANVASARAEYHVQRSYESPTVAAGGTIEDNRGLYGAAATPNDDDINAGITDFEIDLFHRLHDQSRAAFETYLATRSGLAAERISLISETTTAYATLAADEALLSLARTTAASGQRSLELTQALLTSGLGSALDVQNAVTVVEQANADAANDVTVVAQDRNALNLLAGTTVPDNLLPDATTPTTLPALAAGIAAVPAGLSSTVLLQRPDVQEAEHTLKSANETIGAARAAFFPAITLTSSLGLASTALSSLFTAGALNASIAPTVSLPLIGGTNPGNLQYAKAQRDYETALYQKAVQTAFEEVANALARRGTIATQLAAEQRLVTASSSALDLAQAEYKAGTGDYLDVLTAQRTLYANQQAQVSVLLADITSRVSLYAALGAETTP